MAVVAVRPTDLLPAELEQAQRANFIAQDSSKPLRADSRLWIDEIDRLATKVSQALQLLRSRTGRVFLAADLDTHMDLRDDISEYLSATHFRAAPEPAAILDDRAACQQILTDCACAVHFIGGARDSSLELIQDSARLCKGPTLVFQPFGAKLTAAEEAFFEQIDPHQYPDRIGPNVTELKKVLTNLLTGIRNKQSFTPASLGLVCDPEDFAWAETFRAEGLSVCYPSFLMQSSDGPAERIQKWRHLIRNSHGLLFYNGNSDTTHLERVWRMAEESSSNAILKWFIDNPDVEAKRLRHPSDPVYPAGLNDFLASVREKAKA